MSSVYLDFNATTPLAAEVIEAISTSLGEDWGNPSSSHQYGRQAKLKIDESRVSLAQAIGASDHQIIFTSGGTEALNWVINSLCKGECHSVASALEHCAVYNPLEALPNCQVDYVHPAHGLFSVNADQIIEKIKPQTKLVAVMMANNETGAIQPVEEIGRRIQELQKSGHQVKFLVDASQTFGKIPVDVNSINCDFLVLAGHKFYGPRIGIVYIRHPEEMTPLLYGGGQEFGLRPGTENTPMIVGLGVAARLVNKHLHTYTEQMKNSRDLLREKITQLTEVQWLSAEPCLPNTLLVSLPKIKNGQSLINSLDGKLMASTGAACHSGTVGSCVLNACGIDIEVQERTIRFSTGRTTTKDDIDLAAKLITSCLPRVLGQL